MKAYWRVSLAVVIVAVLILTSCGPSTPEVVEKVITETVKETVIVEGTPQVVEKEVTKVVKETVVVKEEVEVTPTPVPPKRLHIATGSGRQLSLAKYATKWFAEQYNIELEWTHWAGSETESAMTLLASDDPPDIFNTDYPELFYYAGATLPLNDQIEAWEDKAAYSEYFINLHSVPDGAVTGLAFSWPQPSFTIYRQDWLDKVGRDVPETVDDFYEVAKAFTLEDPDGNGEDDTFGFGWNKNFLHPMINPLYYAFGGRWLKIEDGEYVPGFTGEEGYKFLSLLVKMFDEGLIPKTSLELEDNVDATRDLLFLPGKVGMIFEGANSSSWMDTVIGPDVVEVAYPPTDGEHMGAGAGWPLSTWVVSRSCQDPELCWKWFEWWYSLEGQHQLTYGYEGVQYERKPDGAFGPEDYIIPPGGPTGMKADEYWIIFPKATIARQGFEYEPFTEDDPRWWRPYMEKPGRQHEIVADLTQNYIVLESHPNWPLYAETVSKWFARAALGEISVDEAIAGAAQEVEEQGILKIGD